MSPGPDNITAPWLRAPGPRAVMQALAAAGHQAWYVGGCVRNALLGGPDSDIDIATRARPEGQSPWSPMGSGMRSPRCAGMWKPTGAMRGCNFPTGSKRMRPGAISP